MWRFLYPTEINFIVKKIPKTKIPDTNAFIGKFNQYLRKKEYWFYTRSSIKLKKKECFPDHSINLKKNKDWKGKSSNLYFYEHR